MHQQKNHINNLFYKPFYSQSHENNQINNG